MLNSCLRFKINSYTIDNPCERFCQHTRYLKDSQSFNNNAIHLAHQPHITCLDELWVEIERKPDLQAVFFDALIAPSPQNLLSSLSLRFMFERRFRFSMVNPLPEHCGGVDDFDGTPQIKRRRVNDSVMINGNSKSVKAIIILDAHTMADYWAPDKHKFKNYARLGAFRYTPTPLSPPASTTATDVRQSEHLQRVPIVMPSMLRKNGLPSVLYS